MKIYYLVYVYMATIKIRQCQRDGRNFVPTDKNCKYRYHTNIPDEPLKFQHGKIYCEFEKELDYCISVIKDHYKDRVLQLEKSVANGKAIIGG